MYSISFCVPETKILKDPIKTSERSIDVAPLIPGVISTYKYNTEEAYYSMYSNSKIAITCKKGGWDCLRHYEIIACGAIPWFDKIDKCPEKSLTHLPKELLIEIYRRIDPFNPSTIHQVGKRTLDEWQFKLMKHLKEHLTTVAMAQYMLRTMNIRTEDIHQMLFLSDQKDCDYTRCLLLHGFKTLFGTNCVDRIQVDHLYDDFPEESVKNLYGKGFTYSRTLSKDLKCSVSDEEITENIKSKTYDLIIYGSLHRGMSFFELVTNHQDNNKLAFICGEDLPEYSWFCKNQCKTMNFPFVFIREL